MSGPARVFRNTAAARGHWLLVRAIDPRLNRDAYGAEITVRSGSRRWVRRINPAFSYATSNDPRADFGLGGADRVDSIDVVWPDGAVETFPAQPVDRLIVVRRGSGAAR